MLRYHFELSQQGIAGLVANLYKADAEIAERLTAAGRQWGHELQHRTEFYTPRRTGFMQEHVQLKFFNDDTAFEVGWSADDFFSAGLAFYPWFVEFGTIHMAAQFPLTTAYNEVMPLYEAAVSQIVRDAIARFEARARAA